MFDSSRQSFRRPLAVLLNLVALVVLCTMSGCISGRIGGSEPSDKVIDELRTDNIALKREVATLQKNIDQRLAEIDTLQQQVNGARPMSGVDAPSLASLKFGRYTAAVDTDGDKRDDLIRLYIQTLDQQSRFLPVAGKATVQAVLLLPDHEPLVLSRIELTPKQWDESYRTGLTGTHYTVDMPLTGPGASAMDALKKGVHEITVMVSFTDAATGAAVQAQATYPVRR